jgi:hypothetical protein
VAADVGEKELQAVGRARDLGGRLEAGGLLLGSRALGVGRSGGLGGAGGSADLEPDPLELGRQLLDLLLVQVELEGKRLQLGRLEVTTLLRALDEGAGLVGLEQLVQLILGQCLLSPLGPASADPAVVLTLRGKSSPCHQHLQPWPFEARTSPIVRLFRRGRLFRLRADGEVELDLSLLI